MFEAEIVGHTVVLASNLQNKMAFNAYGEVVFMLAQNAVLLALIYRSAPPKAARTAALWGAYFAAVAAHVAGACLFRFARRLVPLTRACVRKLTTRDTARCRAALRGGGGVQRVQPGVLVCARAADLGQRVRQKHRRALRPLHRHAGRGRRRCAWCSVTRAPAAQPLVACALCLFPRRICRAVRILTTIQEGGGRNMLLG